MGRKRKSNHHLPARVYWQNGRFRYLTKDGKWITLGKTYPEAMRTYADIMDGVMDDGRMGSIFDRYLKEVASQKAPTTHKENVRAMGLLRAAFGHLYPTDIRPVMVYKYMDIRRQVSLVGANKEKALLSHVFSYGIRWGLCETNPCADVKSFPEPKRRYEIPDQDFWAFYDYAPPVIKAAMLIALLTGLRLGDILKLQLANLTDKGLQVETSKTGKRILFEWSDSLRQAVNDAKTLRRGLRSMTLVCTRKGQPYTADGFKSLWQRHMGAAEDRGIISQRFQFKDIRKKAATDIEREHGIVAAQKTLGHTTTKTTDSVYIVGTREVKAREVKIKKAN